MKTKRQSSSVARPTVVALLVIFATFGAVTGVTAQERRQQSAPVGQNAPVSQTYRSIAPVQTPASTLSSGGNSTAHVWQYNPPGLNSSSGTYPVQNNPPGLTGKPQEMALPGGLAGAGGAGPSQNVPGPGGPGQPPSGGWGSAYPAGFQAPYALPPPYAYQGQPATRQFTCRTARYVCVVPYTGACQCENDRREREIGSTVD